MSDTFSYKVTDKEGNTFTRTISKRKTKSGRTIKTISGGGSTTKRLSENKDGSQTLQDANLKEQLKAQEAQKKAYEEALKNSNISLATGGIGRVDNAPNMSVAPVSGVMSVENSKSSVVDRKDNRLTPKEFRETFTPKERLQATGLMTLESLKNAGKGFGNVGASLFENSVAGLAFEKATGKEIGRFNKTKIEASKLNNRQAEQALSFVATNPEEVAGYIAGARGLVGGVKAGSAKLGTAIMRTKPATALQASKGGRAVLGTTRFTAQTARTFALGKGFQELGEARVRASYSKEERRLAKQYQSVLFQANKAETEALRGGTGISVFGRSVSPKAIANEISPFFASNDKAFVTSANEALKAQGVTSAKEREKIIRSLLKERTARTTGEFSGLLGASAGAELMGRENLVRNFGKNVDLGKGLKQSRKLFGIGFKSIAPAGFSEGFSQSIIQEQSRKGKASTVNALGVGGFGALSAGVFGGGLVALAPVSKTATKAGEGFLSVLDPFEAPGDFLAGGAKTSPAVLSLSPGSFTTSKSTKSKLGTFVEVPGKGSAKTSAKGTFSNPFTTPAFSFASTPTLTPTPALSFSTSSKGKGKTNTNVFNFANTITNQFSLTSSAFTPTITTSTSKTNTNVNTNTATPSFVPSFTNVPTVTPNLKTLPLPPMFGDFGGNGVGSGTKGRTYLNETALALSALGTTLNTGTKQRKTSKAKTKKARRGKRRK